MSRQRLNPIAVLAAAVVFWLFGALWYNLLSVPWMAAVERTPEQMGRYGGFPYGVAALLCGVAAFGVATAMRVQDAGGWQSGVKTGLFLGVTIFATIGLMQVLFEGHDLMLFAIDGGYGVLGLAIVGAVLGAFKPR